jgi:sarcosine oxidase, subunit alpha
LVDSPPLFRRRTGAARELALRWDRDRLVPARDDDTVSAALLAAGILATSRSLKYRRHRGAFCLQGDCGTCLVRIDGRPNMRACTTRVRDGMRVEPQNRLLPVGPDPTALVDTVFAGGFDHHHFMVRPRVANVVMQEVARGLAGLGKLPEGTPTPRAEQREHAPRVLVVGAGPAGLAAASTLRREGIDVLHVDRLDRVGLGASASTSHDRVMDATGVFGVYPGEGLWAATTRAPGAPEVLRVVRPEHVVLATGTRSPMIPLPGNDRPGVVSAQGLLALLRRSHLELAVPCLVVGEGDLAELAAETLGVERVEPERIDRIEGGRAVTAVRLLDGRRLPCRLVALAPRPAPASELARQAGARVRWSEGGFAVQRDAEGRCVGPNLGPDLGGAPWALWATGDVCGWMGPHAAERDGRRIGGAVARACRGGPR